MGDLLKQIIITPSLAMMVILAVLFVLALVSVWRVHKNPTMSFNLTDIISENGKFSEHKIARLGAWVVSTWGFVYMIVANTMVEWYFVGYMTAWVANALISKNIDAKNQQSPQ